MLPGECSSTDLSEQYKDELATQVPPNNLHSVVNLTIQGKERAMSSHLPPHPLRALASVSSQMGLEPMVEGTQPTVAPSGKEPM